MRPISYLIEECLSQNKFKENTPISEIKEKIVDFFDPILNNALSLQKNFFRDDVANMRIVKGSLKFEEIKSNQSNKKFRGFKAIFKTIKNPEKEIKKDIHPNFQLVLTGYTGDEVHTYELDFNYNKESILNSNEVIGEFSWYGQFNYVQRIILGYDSGLFFNLPIILTSFPTLEKQVALSQQIRGLQAKIQFSVMPLQDGIDLVKLLIETTSALQKFTQGTFLKDGSHGVGGAVDIAVITEKRGFKWIAKKKIKLDGKEIDIEEDDKTENTTQSCLKKLF